MNKNTGPNCQHPSQHVAHNYARIGRRRYRISICRLCSFLFPRVQVGQ